MVIDFLSIVSMRSKIIILSVISIFLVKCSSSQQRQTFNFTRDREYKLYSYGIITGEKPIVWGTPQSTKMIKETIYSKPFFALLPHYAPQLHLTSCGPASARIVLSAIYEATKTPFPVDRENSNLAKENGFTKGKFLFSERAVFDVYKGDDENKHYDVIARLKKRKNGKFNGGIDIAKLADVMNLHPHVKAQHFSVSSVENPKEAIANFRRKIKKVMSSNGVYMLANYHTGAMYPIASGHFSPVVAYHEATDSVLIMDVAGHLGTWVWVKVEELYKSMNTLLNGHIRGYIIIEQTAD